MMIRWSEVG